MIINASEVYKEWERQPTIVESLPCKTTSGFTLENLVVTCNKCSQRILDQLIHGFAAPVLNNVIQVKVIGFCKPCSHLVCSELRYRSTAHGVLKEYQCPKKKTWVIEGVPTKSPKKRSVADRILGLFRNDKY